MRKNMKQVHPEDFDVERLLAAAREGRLYVDENRTAVSREQVIKEVRAYVARIKVMATKRFSSSVDELWDEILADEGLVDFLMPGTKARKCTMFDKYNVMRIIGVLREKGVYESLNDSEYNCLLEQTRKDTSYRKYLGMGIENRQQHLLKTIRRIVADFEI